MNNKMVPSSRPRISSDVVRKIARKQAPGFSVVMVGFRGYYRDTMGEVGKNDIGIYDDAIVLVSDNAFLAVNANTDPSRARPGVATLIPGVHMYKKGMHGISRGPGYPAFRPATLGEVLPVTREGQKGTKWGVAINIHKGGYATTSSEGCQTVYPDQWLGFQQVAYAELERYGQIEFPYVLVDNGWGS